MKPDLVSWTPAQIGAGITAAVALGALYLLGRRVAGNGASSSSSSSGPAMVTAPPASSPSNADAHKAARPILVEAFQRVMKRAPSLAEIQYAHAVAWLESNYGRGWKGAMNGANNWGAVQCPQGVSGAGNCIEYEDGRADGSRYKISFRAYPTPVDGAVDVIRHVFVLRPRTAAALASHGASAFRASFAMRRERYYEGYCPAATKAYGTAVRASLANPDKDAATKACAQEATTAHAQRVANIMSQVAGACGDAVALGLGTWEDADAWYRAGEGDKASSSPAPAAPAAAPAPSAPASPAPASASPAPAAPSSSTGPRVVAGLAGHRLLEAVKAGAHEAPTWVEMRWEKAGVTVRVSADALRAPVDGQLLRLPVTWQETVEIAAALDCVPLTAELSDAIWRAAEIKLTPHPLGEWGTPEQAKASSQGQMTVDWCRKYNAQIDAELGGRTGSRADVGKDWILSRRLLLGPHLGVTYGWRYPNGDMIQKPGPDTKLPVHNDAHYDYSQVLRLARREPVGGGDLLNVYATLGLPDAVIRLARPS